MSKKLFVINVIGMDEAPLDSRETCEWVERTLIVTFKEESVAHKKELLEKLANELIDEHIPTNGKEIFPDFYYDKKSGKCDCMLTIKDSICGARAELIPCEVVEF